MEDFRKATEFVRGVWTDAKTNASFYRFDAVNAKYEGQFGLEVRQLWPPNVTMQDITGWWFTDEDCSN
jgi:hypothetical protein